MDLLLVRHALPTRIVRDDGEPADPPLSDEGRLQARKVAAWLAQERLSAVLTSPLRRAVQTAEPIAEPHGLAPVVHEGVAEYDAASSAYIPVEELSREELRAMVDEWTDPSRMMPFRERVVDAVQDIVRTYTGQTVAVVCHGGVVNAVLSWVLDTPRVMVFDPTYTSITRLRTNGKQWTVRSVGEAGHLR